MWYRSWLLQICLDVEIAAGFRNCCRGSLCCVHYWKKMKYLGLDTLHRSRRIPTSHTFVKSVTMNMEMRFARHLVRRRYIYAIQLRYQKLILQCLLSVSLRNSWWSTLKQFGSTLQANWHLTTTNIGQLCYWWRNDGSWSVVPCTQ